MYLRLLVDAPLTHHHWRRMMRVVTVQAHGVFSSLCLSEVILDKFIDSSSLKELVDIEIIGICFHFKHLCHPRELKCNYTRRFVDRVNINREILKNKIF